MRRILVQILASGLAASSAMAAEPTPRADPALERKAEPSQTAEPAVGPAPGAATDQPAESTETTPYFSVKLGGFVRVWASMNMQDAPELLAESNPSDPYHSAWKPSMFRGSMELSADAKTGPVSWRAVGRGDREVLTTYERKLQNRNLHGNGGILANGPGSDLRDYYQDTKVRELYADFDLGPQLHFRLGKQQVVWGETDFFHPTDLIHGYDFRWRSFLEAESDEVRKPLILANLKIAVPELAGTLQIVVRPGIDARRDIGNTYSQSGGRWAAQPYKGEDFLAPGITYYDYEHPSGDYQDVTGGLRWTGSAGKYNYALSWLRTFNPDPVFNPSASPYLKTPTGSFGDWFYPLIEVTAASISTEVGLIDSVVNAEVAYHQNKLFNTGTQSEFGGLTFPGVGPIVKKNAIQTALRVDKQFRWTQSVLGTNAPSFFTVQLFDTWIQNFKRSEDIVENVGFGARALEHQTIATAVLALDYMSSKLKPQIAAGAYLQSGDAFVIPSVAYSLGNHWRLLAEADIFIPMAEKSPVGQPLVGETETATRAIGPLSNNNQLMLRATYQF